MRLKTNLVLSATGLTFAIVLVLSSIFVGELLRQRIDQAAADNDVLAHEVLLMTRQAVEAGLRTNPPVDKSDEALHAALRVDFWAAMAPAATSRSKPKPPVTTRLSTAPGDALERRSVLFSSATQ